MSLQPTSQPLTGVAAASSPPEVIEALVQTGSEETTYHRFGRGPAVLLLGTGGLRGPLGTWIVNALGAGFRVIAPLAPVRSGAPDPTQPRLPACFSGWLRDVIDGLGLVRPSIVAGEEFGVAALGFAVLDSERTDRLVLIQQSLADPFEAGDGIADVLRRSGHPLLVLRLSGSLDRAEGNGDEPQEAAREQLIRFLTAAD